MGAVLKETMWDKDEYFKGISIVKIGAFILFLFGMMVMVSQIRAQSDNATEKLLQSAPNNEEWTTQILYDTVNACYQGTVKWIVMSNPQLIGTIPPPVVQRKMLEHCFCVLDKIRTEYPLSKYIENVFDTELIGNLFMSKALECVQERDTLEGILQLIPDNKTTTDNSTIIPELEEDSEESSPDQPRIRESLSDSETIFQG